MRLTNNTYEYILKKVVDGAFGKKKAALLKREKATADEIYAFLVPKRAEKSVLELKGGWYFLADDLKVHTPSSGYITLKLSKVRPVPNGYLVIEDPEIEVKAVACEKARNALETERHNFKVQTEKFLRQFTTLKKLRENWPEGENFYEDLDADKAAPGTGLMISPAFIAIALEEGSEVPV